ncbi:hypothetical protein BK131_12840 [Paenibacillus amylolyticus]|uniref:Uncharacterized protein n=1 Tax=Paenibacillus amylolyticus TaxID=1451 RepID=A0A1R1BWZ8_PAEAM|nr:hypothetical protein [Paenibacillus amylolyticus]OMF14351.1 hypothetical protein BK131_12840 [Paenibacillus amylolyticus]
MAEMIVGLSKSNAEMRTTLRYLDQIQRSTERLGRVRYQSLIKVNNELRTTGRRLEHIYSMAVRISRLRITPTIGLIDKLSPALDRAWVKLNRFRDQMVTASGTVSLEVRQKIEVAMGKAGPTGPTMAVMIQNNKNITNNTKEEEPKKWWENVLAAVQAFNDLKDAAFNVGDIFKLFKKKKEESPASDPTRSPASKCCCCTGGKMGKNRRVRSPNADGGGSDRGRRNYRSGRRSSNRSNRGPSPVPNPVPDTPTPPVNRNRNRGGGRRIRGSGRLGFADGGLGSLTDMLAGNGLMDNLSSGFAKGAKRLLGPISMLADVANVATAPPEERGRAVGSMIGGTAGTAIGSAIGSVLLPGIGTWVGGAVGGWAGSAAGGWIGDHAKDIGKFMSNATEGVGDALSGAADYVSEKTKKITDGISGFFGFGSKKEEKTVSAATVASPSPVATGPQMAPVYIPPALTMTGPTAYMNSKVGQPTSAGFMGTSMMQSQAMAPGNGAQTNGKSSTMTVQISEEQMSSLSGYLKDFKTETTNQIAINIPPGAVQVTVRENAIDYDAVSHQVGQRISNEFRRAMQNRKTIMA